LKYLTYVGHSTLLKELYFVCLHSRFLRNKFNYRLKVQELPFLYNIYILYLSLLVGFIFCSTFFMLAHSMYLQILEFVSHLNMDINLNMFKNIFAFFSSTLNSFIFAKH
jgi:hypothetical protein